MGTAWLTCHGCGVSVSEGDEHCPRCGREIEYDLMCPNCDEKLDDPDLCEICYWEPGDDLSEPITGSDHLRGVVLGGAMQSRTTSGYQDPSWRPVDAGVPDPAAPWWHWVILLAVVVALVAIFSAAGLMTVDPRKWS